ncbi:MAG: hypothetical protein ACD_22C00082G0015 [uncultured bacterium]|nr:MAG: hypothetical protein ACD_22C00082G0015 [uncultured bacterium]
MNIFNQLALLISSAYLALIPTTKYVEGVVGQPRSFLPSQTQTQADKTISTLIFRGLFKYDIYGVLIPDLAETWTISEDGLSYTIKIKDNQHWSDGSKITSDDLIYSAFKTPDLVGVATDRVDDLTVKYTLPNKFSPFLDMLTIGVMKHGEEEAKHPLNPISNGKFKVLRVERSGPAVNSVVLYNTDPNDDIKKLVFKYYVNEEELYIGAKLGEVDGFIANKDYELPNFNEYKFPLQGVYYALYFNLQNDKLKDVEFRNKLAETLPISNMIETYGILAQGPVSRSVFTENSLAFDKFNKDFVDEAIAQTITITVPDIKQHVEMVEKVKDIWEDKLGLTININKVDPTKFNEEIIKDRNFEVLFYGQEISRDPDRYINWHSTQKDAPGLNLSGFDGVRADRALEEGRKEIDNTKRMTHYYEFQKTIMDQAPAVFLYHPFAKYYVSKYITGIGEKYTFTITDRFLDFFNWQRTKII